MVLNLKVLTFRTIRRLPVIAKTTNKAFTSSYIAKLKSFNEVKTTHTRILAFEKKKGWISSFKTSKLVCREIKLYQSPSRSFSEKLRKESSNNDKSSVETQSNANSEEIFYFNKKNPKPNLTGQAKQNTNEILLMTHTSSRYYYLINISFLLLYVVVSVLILYNPDYPDFLKSTTAFFLTASIIVLLFILFYSKRHIKSMTYIQSNKAMKVDVYGRFGFFERTFYFSLKDLTSIVPASKYIRSKRTGVYVLQFGENAEKFHTFFNYLFMRPVTFHNKDLFDSLLKPKIKR